MYKVLKYFTDLQDNNHEYQVGDTFPRLGLVVSKERIKELSTDANRQKTPLITKDEKVEPKKEEKNARRIAKRTE